MNENDWLEAYTLAWILAQAKMTHGNKSKKYTHDQLEEANKIEHDIKQLAQKAFPNAFKGQKITSKIQKHKDEIQTKLKEENKSKNKGLLNPEYNEANTEEISKIDEQYNQMLKNIITFNEEELISLYKLNKLLIQIYTVPFNKNYYAANQRRQDTLKQYLDSQNEIKAFAKNKFPNLKLE